MFCPICKNEYREGFTKCAECGVDLVETLDENDGNLLFMDVDALKQQLLSNAEASEEILEELSEESQNLSEEDGDDKIVIPQIVVQKAAPEYVEPKARAKDYKSSALTLLIVGFAGLIVLALMYFDIIRVPLSSFSKILVTVVMGIMFAGFIVMGFVSMKSYRKLKNLTGEIEEKQDEIREWAKEHFNAEGIDAALEECSEDEKYFLRIDLMRSLLTEAYQDIDESYQDYLLEEVYNEIFKDE